MATVIFGGGCPHSGIELKPSQPPNVTDLNNQLQLNAVMYIDDLTYRKDPQLLLGKVATIRKPANGDCSPDDPAGRIFFVGKVAPLKFAEPSTPELSKSIVVDKKLSANASFLTFLSSSVDDSHVTSIVVSDQVQRVDDADPSYQKSFEKFKTAHQALFDDPDICWILQVDGYAHKTIVSKLFEKTAAQGQGGAYGVKVGADYYSSNESNEVFHRFGLSVTIRKRPLGLHIQAVDTKPSAEEAGMLSKLSAIPDKTN